MLADSNLPIYAIQPQHAPLRAWMVQTLPTVSIKRCNAGIRRIHLEPMDFICFAA